MTTGGSLTICHAHRVGKRAIVSRRYDLLAQSTLSLVVSFNITLSVGGPPFAMIFSSSSTSFGASSQAQAYSEVGSHLGSGSRVLRMHQRIDSPFRIFTAMDAGVSTQGLRVQGVSIRDDAWVTNFVAEKVDTVILDFGKIDHVLTDGIIDCQILCCVRTHALVSLPADCPSHLFQNHSGF